MFLWDNWGVCCSFWCWLDHSFEATSANPGSAKLASRCCDAINSETHSSQCCNQGDPFYTDKSGFADVGNSHKPGSCTPHIVKAFWVLYCCHNDHIWRKNGFQVWMHIQMLSMYIASLQLHSFPKFSISLGRDFYYLCIGIILLTIHWTVHEIWGCNCSQLFIYRLSKFQKKKSGSTLSSATSCKSTSLLMADSCKLKVYVGITF